MYKENLINKLLLLVLSVCAAAMEYGIIGMMISAYSAAALSLFSELPKTRGRRVPLFTLYCALCLFHQPFVFMLPLMLYEMLPDISALLCIIPAVILTMSAGEYSPILLSATATLCILGALLRIRYITSEKRRRDYIATRDNLTEVSMRLSEKVRELDEERERAVGYATMAERERIAREIHDSVGHLLSSSILQLGAILSVSRDEAMREPLEALRDTLSRGMNEIRESVHNLRDNSIDLYSELNRITSEFAFCHATLQYELDTAMSAERSRAVIAIVKEALVNVTKHSDATLVTVSLFEHPALYQLIIRDNGNPDKKARFGMGIQGMQRRAEDMGGVCNISVENGFRVFISFRKDNSDEHNNCR